MTYRVSVGLSRRYKAWYAPSSISKATVVWRVFRSVSCPWSSKRPLQCWKSAVSSAALRISLCPPCAKADRAAIWARRATEHVDDLSGSSRNLGLPACCSANRRTDSVLVEGLLVWRRDEFTRRWVPMWRNTRRPRKPSFRLSASSDTSRMDKYYVETTSVMVDVMPINPAV
jgi:hypothetical protein